MKGGAAKKYGRSIRGAIALAALALVAVGIPAALPASAAAEQCPNAQFRTGPSSHLPDCRAYEMVTPPYKGTGIDYLFTFTPNGTSLLTFGTEAFGEAEGFPNVFIPTPAELYTTQRTATGWVSMPDDLSATEYIPFYENGFENWAGQGGENPGGPATVWMARGVWQGENRIDFFMRNPDRSVVDIGPALPPSTPPQGISNLGNQTAGLNFIELSRNGSHYFFDMRGDYWPSDETLKGRPSLYEYGGSSNTTPLLVGVNDEGKEISQCGVELGGIANSNSSADSEHNAVSADGNVVFFTPRTFEPSCKEGARDGSGPPVLEIFARIDNGLPSAHTVAISEPSKEDCAKCDTEAGVLAGAYFEGASSDGSKVFFTTVQPLLGGGGGTNVYEYDFDAPAGERLIRVSVGDATVSNPSAEVVALREGESPLNSEDGSHVYFIARGILTKTPNADGEAAEAGANNLYVFERDARFPSGHLAFVARLSARDLIGWSPDLTPDGRFLVFVSERDLTPDTTSTGVRQVFEYDAQTGSLVRVSIGQEGYNDDGNVPAGFTPSPGEVAEDAKIVSPRGYGNNPYTYLQSSVSADGSYVFFQSIVGLTPNAFDREAVGNEGPFPIYADNVYEYHDGRVSLISDGQDVHIFNSYFQLASELIGTDPSGEDVYLTTMDHLVGQDTDTNIDIYDARIDGGFPGPAQSPSCSGDACQGPLSAAPTLLSPGSEFQAGGNPPLTAESTPKAKPRAKAKAKTKAKGKVKHGTHSRRRRKARTANDRVIGGRARR